MYIFKNICFQILFITIAIYRNYEAITMAVSQLLILDWKTCSKCSNYTLEVSTQHPFITILNQEKHSWRLVLNHMKYIIFDHHDEKYVFIANTNIIK